MEKEKIQTRRDVRPICPSDHSAMPQTHSHIDGARPELHARLKQPYPEAPSIHL